MGALSTVVLTLSKLGKALGKNPITNLLDVQLSSDANNTLSFGSDNGLFVLGNSVPTIESIVSSSTVTPGTDSNGNTINQLNITALAESLTIEPPSGNAVDGQKLLFRLKDNGVPKLLLFVNTNGGYRSVGEALPTSTVAGKVLYIGCIYNSADEYWDIIAVAEQ